MTRKLIFLPVVALALASAASAAASPQSKAERALAEAQALLGDVGGSDGPEALSASAGGGREATLVLRDLALGLEHLDGADRRTAERILARPDQGSDPDSFGSEAAKSPHCSANFCVHWGVRARSAPPPKDVAPANGIPDFVEDVLDAADTSYAVENTSLGWRDPMPDGRRGSRKGKGTAGETDIYLTALQRGLFGYAQTDAGESGRRQSAYLVLDNDYAGFNGVPVDLMRVTMAHEYNHILQFAYDVFQDDWMFESTATFMEDYVYPDINDYLNFMPDFVRSSRTPLAEENGSAFKLYGSAVWNHFIAGRWGPGVVENAWAVSPKVKPKHFAAAAYERSLRESGAPGFSREFAEFATETAEWRSSTAFPDAALYADMKRSGKLKGKPKKLRLDHTGYALLDVKPRGGELTLKVTTEKGVRSSVALVGRDGGLTDGVVTESSAYLGKGGKAKVSLPDAGRFERVTAVIANADARVKEGSRRYRADDVKYRAALR